MGNPLTLSIGPGLLYLAPTGSTEPTDLATAWAAAWLLLGYTDKGSKFSIATKFDDVLVAEELDPVTIRASSRTVQIDFELAEVTATNLKRVMNGGTITGGSGCVLYDPPTLGQEVPVMLGWQSDDTQERWIFRQCFQTGSVDVERRKSPQKALLPTQWRAVKPAGLNVYRIIEASPARA